MRLDVFLHSADDSLLTDILGRLKGIDAQLKSIIQTQGGILQKEESIMASLDDLTTEVANESTIVDSMDAAVSGIVTAIADVRAQLQAAINSGDPAKVQAAVDQIKALEAKITSQKDALVAAAVTPPDVGTPPTP